MHEILGGIYDRRSHGKRQMPAAGWLHHLQANRPRYKYAVYAGEVWTCADSEPQQQRKEGRRRDST